MEYVRLANAFAQETVLSYESINLQDLSEHLDETAFFHVAYVDRKTVF